ncbi:hypothetical protein M011DRAFT_463003 [Sporormia fimetaria CBS 119925]|uniref:Uncharacterized protein n=1 Tax=Sporormia fimetaria CBS 119925 TaxID=1340428 RepID=A0A6A6UTY4_9PLEO|nr:hypothetical protein M011DRAFT_463003 [Sporormia fimetaria CBS 119925]
MTREIPFVVTIFASCLAPFSGLLVFVHLCHLCQRARPHLCQNARPPLRLWLYIGGYSVAIGLLIAGSYLLKTDRMLRTLMELTWWNGLGGQICIFWSFEPSTYHAIWAGFVAFFIQFIGFVVAQTSLDPLYAWAFLAIGPILFQIYITARMVAYSVQFYQTNRMTRRLAAVTSSLSIALVGHIGFSVVLSGDWLLLIILLGFRYTSEKKIHSPDGLASMPKDICMYSLHQDKGTTVPAAPKLCGVKM